MREVVLQVAQRDAEAILDRLLPVLPGGVREVPRGRRVELRMRGAEVPTVDELARLTGQRPSRFTERQVPDDWRERRRADYEPDVVGGRLVVAPEWAPRSGASIEITLREASAFGGGNHPTTRKCLELLLDIAPLGSFADLGCGTGVLGILAGKLGWEPVTAVDIRDDSVEATRANALANDVQIDARVLDLVAEPPPTADGLAANVAPAIHRSIASALPEDGPRLAVVSGFHSSEAAGTAAAYAERGLAMRRQLDVDGWSILVLEKGLPRSST